MFKRMRKILPGKSFRDPQLIVSYEIRLYLYPWFLVYFLLKILRTLAISETITLFPTPTVFREG